MHSDLVQNVKNGYNNVILHLGFIQDLVGSLSDLREKIDAAITKNDSNTVATLLFAMHIQITASIMSGIINHPGIIEQKIKLFESMMIDPGQSGLNLDPSRN